ncbi:chemotaxis protein CheX [Alicyclobacillus sp. SO9]|uniref:chemotaxis protein CheX n=1 Tax=Alicyclobacillus sp. SO9 TaxID=2665646 RepID=UPI0018E7DDE4|nr:chemotaxis protein CheX [Alicyclobacillus sp. SO9]QQE79268.1 chemotaxis protein CheX [Alicyclobacillus sp. SO9]
MGGNSALSSVVTEILNSTLDAVTTVISSPVNLGAPELLKNAIHQPEMGVLIGIAGDYPSRLIIEAKRDVYSTLAASMYGMALEGEMLESFVGEIGNMVGGNMCTNMSERGMLLEVTPPTVLVGQTKLSGFHTALSVAGTVESVGDMRISLLITEG